MCKWPRRYRSIRCAAHDARSFTPLTRSKAGLLVGMPTHPGQRQAAALVGWHVQKSLSGLSPATGENPMKPSIEINKQVFKELEY